MSEPRIVTPEEAQEWLNRGSVFPSDARLILPTIATEPDRIRAAVAKALRYVAGESKTEIMAYADSIENGADHA